MAEGMLKLSGSYYVLSTTGVAGPGPRAGVKAGEVFIALAQMGGETVCEKFLFTGSRPAVKRKAALTALDLLRKNLLGI